MVVAVTVAETVTISPRLTIQESSVCSHLEYVDSRRHRQEVRFTPVLAPVKYADTVFVYINNTHKRFLSKTFYEPRVKPTSFAETTFAGPKRSQEIFVSYLDHNVDQKRKWFKTSVEIKGRKFTSSRVLPLPPPIDINSNTITGIEQSAMENRSPPRTLGLNGYHTQNGENFTNGDVSERGGGFKEKYDPGASQVLIPKRKRLPSDDEALLERQLLIDFPNSKVDLRMNGSISEYSDV